MKDLRNAVVTIANASNKEQSFVPYAQSFLYRLAPQDAIQFPAKSVQAIYYQKQNQGPIAAQAIGEDDVKVIAGTFDGTTFTKSDNYMYVGGKIVGEIPYETSEVIGFGEGNRICLHFVNPTITSKDELPEGIICKTLDTRTEQGYNEYTKDAFEDDGSLIYIANMQNLKKWVEINWGEGFVRYDIDCSKAQLEPKGETPPQPTTYTITVDITNGSSSGATFINTGETAVVNLVPTKRYELPTSISVTNATYEYEREAGTVTLSNPHGDIVITVVCPGQLHTITANITNGTYNGADSIEYGTSIGVEIVADNGYILPPDITVVGASYEYNYVTGSIELTNATADVTITAVCEAETTPLTPVEVGDTAQYLLFNGDMPLVDIQSRVQQVPIPEGQGGGSVLAGHVDAMGQDFDLVFAGNFDQVGQEWIGAGFSSGQASGLIIWSAVAITVDQKVITQGWQDTWSDSQSGFSWDKDTMTLQFPAQGTVVSVNASLNGYVFGKVE